MLVAIGVIEIGKQTIGNVKGKRRTGRQWGWRDWVRSGNGRREYPGRESRGGPGFRERFWTEVLDTCVEMGDLETSGLNIWGRACFLLPLDVQTGGGPKS
jgi:hypothetical protein